MDDQHAGPTSSEDAAALSRRLVLKGLGAFAAGTALAACSSSAKAKPHAAATTVPTLPRATTTTTATIRRPGSLPNPRLPEGTDTMPQIEHIVVLMMENHSYDDHFGMLKRGDGFKLGPDGLPLDANLHTEPGKLLKAFHMPSTCQLHAHPAQDWNSSHTAYNNGRNDGFVKGSGPVAMGYWDGRDIPFYYGLAQTFPVADRYFCSVLAQTYPNRRFLVAGTAAGIISTSGPDLVAPEPHNGTIFERLDTYGITWRNYYNDLPAAVGVIPTVLAKHPHQIAKASQFVTDAAEGKLPSVSYVDPNFGIQSEENPQDIRQGERFAAAIINAAMHGPAWAKTVLIWTYDEHGGYYDHVPPPPAIKPDGIPPEIHVPQNLPGAYDRYGFRVPAVIVSPHARPNYVSHVVHDHTSVLKLIETKWNLGALTYRDANADDLLDSLDFASKPPFLEPPTLPSPALPASTEIDPSSDATDRCSPGEPGGTIPPLNAIVSADEAPRLRVGAS
ncbi:MAG TPA: alkaline phosphatase family protein [Acidimicrobiia bacterium]|nr:alkaline phosphatase family protein [Acidimicrobiia bacterium]